MKILFDYQAFELQKHGGVSRSFAELYHHLCSNGAECILGIKETDNVYLRTDIHRPYLYTHDKIFGKKQHFPGQWRLTQKVLSVLGFSSDFRDLNKRYSINLLKRQEFDVFHPTFFDTYFLPFLNKKPFVLTIHDMIPELYPQYYRRDDFQIISKRILSSRASAIIAVSEKTKEDIVRILNVPEEKIHVIYHGCSFPKDENPKRLYAFPYLLFVGDRSAYKDFFPFVRKLAVVLKRHPEIKLVCTGRSFSLDELSLFDILGIKNQVINKWVTSDAEFFSLYHYAECFVFPSEYEGFGIPILEAYTADCPVLLNHSSCFPEIAGEAAEYFTFNVPDDLEEKIEHMISLSPDEKEVIIQKQRKRLTNFSWAKSAEQLKSVYSSVY